MLSGVLIKALGVYALMRVVFNVFGVSLPVAWILISLGIVSMIAGAFLALGQWDFKRLLAYSSISQIGYVVLGIGLGGLIISRGGNPTWASLAFLGALLHLINHSVYKSLRCSKWADWQENSRLHVQPARWPRLQSRGFHHSADSGAN